MNGSASTRYLTWALGGTEAVKENKTASEKGLQRNRDFYGMGCNKEVVDAGSPSAVYLISLFFLQ
ncbi:MAG TPA: hypothetical protein VHA09_09910 [Nitrososphaera sp.]|nr:hypothetical protein [Nitrososphaera sp.]